MASNLSFKVDFSDLKEVLVNIPVHLWVGVPKVTPKKKGSMAIYIFLAQHIINSLKSNGKVAIVVPTGSITDKGGIENKVSKHIIDKILFMVVYLCLLIYFQIRGLMFRCYSLTTQNKQKKLC